MGNQPIEVFGITPPSHFPQCPPHHPCTQFCESDIFYLPSKKIKTVHIQQVCLNLVVHSFKTICTPLGNKLVISGEKQIKIVFAPNGSCHSLYAVNFQVPFCAFILLKDLHDDVIDICALVEDISVQCIDSHSLSVSSIIFLCPIIKKDHQVFPCLPPSPPICMHCHSNLTPT